MLAYNEFPLLGEEYEASSTEVASLKISAAESYIIYGAGRKRPVALEKLSKLGRKPLCIIDKRASGEEKYLVFLLRAWII